MLKIYYKYSTLENLEPISGDRINELNWIDAISKNFQVFYSGYKYLGNYKFSSLRENLDYDLYIIRANKKEFMAIPREKKKIWVASPYDLDCFNHADRVATFSQAWADDLISGVTIPGLNPYGLPFKKTIVFRQAVGKHFDDIKGFARSGELRIGHFGRIRKSNYPYLLKYSWPYIKEKFSDAKIITGSLTDEFPISGRDVENHYIDYKTIPVIIKSCDVIVLGQHGAEWDICGNIKTKEAMYCGVPVILERSRAREEEFGVDYPYFLPRCFCNCYPDEMKKDALLVKIYDARLNGMPARVERMAVKYSIENVAKYFKDILTGIINE